MEESTFHSIVTALNNETACTNVEKVYFFAIGCILRIILRIVRVKHSIYVYTFPLMTFRLGVSLFFSFARLILCQNSP